MSRQGTVAGYGMVARESVQPGELLFAVPRAALLSQHTCSISGVLERGGHADRGGEMLSWAAGSPIFVSPPERGALQSQSGWVPLLLALLHEMQAPASLWRPYFALWPESWAAWSIHVLVRAVGGAGERQHRTLPQARTALALGHRCQALGLGGWVKNLGGGVTAGQRRSAEELLQGTGALPEAVEKGFGQHPQRVLFHCAALHGHARSFQPQGPISGTLPPARGSCDGLQVSE